jgi:hypothetical protein
MFPGTVGGSFVDDCNAFLNSPEIRPASVAEWNIGLSAGCSAKESSNNFSTNQRLSTLYISLPRSTGGGLLKKFVLNFIMDAQ